MHVEFLGTSSGAPTPTRNVTSHALVFDDGAVWMLDAGEGTQHRVLRARFGVGRLRRILVTHLHGDHVFGLPGLLCSLSLNGRSTPVELVGPVGLRAFVEHALAASESHLSYPLEWTELAGERDLGTREGIGLSAHPIVHRVPCFGYVVTEPARRGRFDPAKARALRVPEGPAFGRLGRGESIRLDDGRTVEPEDVVGPARAGRKVVLLGDTRDPSGIAEAGAGCDLLVHEATYDTTRHDLAHENGHSTTTMAGAFAARIGARKLVITHFSARYTAGDATPGVAQLLAEARAAAGDRVVEAADDGSIIEMPLQA